MVEKLIKINDGPGCKKPEVSINHLGTPFIVYEKNNDIKLSKYYNNNAVYLKNISHNDFKSYEPDISIPKNGNIHIAWCDQINNQNFIKYIYYDGLVWSKIFNMAMIECDNIEDLRLSVDNSGNVFIVFMAVLPKKNVKCYFISKYGNNISFQDFPVAGRNKHPDIKVNDKYIFITWQHKAGGNRYSIVNQSRLNEPGSKWKNLISVKRGYVQRSKFDIDEHGFSHVVFWEGEDPDRVLNYKQKAINTFVDEKTLSGLKPETYHYCDISVFNKDNMVATMQKGGSSDGNAIFYNWKIKGIWQGFSPLKNSADKKPVKQSVYLNNEKCIITFAEKDRAIWLVEMKKPGIKPIEPPEIKEEDVEKIKKLEKEIVGLNKLNVKLKVDNEAQEKTINEISKKLMLLENPPKWKLFPKKSGIPGFSIDLDGLLKKIWKYILIFAIGVIFCATVF